MSQIELKVDGVMVYSSGATQPVPTPVPIPTPTPTPTPPPPPAGQNVLPWEPFQTVGFFPIPAVQFSGDAGIAIRVLADATKYSNGININLWDQSPQGVLKEIVVSQYPNDFRVVDGNRIVGTGGMKRGVYFYNTATGHTTPGAVDIVVQANQYFYINTRQYWTPRTVTMSAQFSATGR